MLHPKWAPWSVVARLLPLAALMIGLFLLRDRLAGVDVVAFRQAISALTPGQWLGALALTGASFAAIGQYDVVAHRVMGTGVPPGRARWAGVRAQALAQTLGFGSLAGGLVRMRCLPELDLWRITRLSLLVSASFLACWAVLSGVVMLIRSGQPIWVTAPLLVLILVMVLRLRPQLGLPGLGPAAAGWLLVWTTIDVACAALAFGVLLPGAAMPPFSLIFAAYLLALGVGLLSQSPAGMGAFEITILALLPGVAAPEMLAALLAYRVVYHLIPALLALLSLIRPARLPKRSLLQPATGTARLRALARAPQAEWGLAHQGAQILLARDQGSGWLVRQAFGTLVALGRPLGRADLAGLQAHARHQGLGPLLYKCDPRSAARARAAGWRVLCLAQDGLIALPHWSTAGPEYRQLRRKLRSAAQSGLRIEPVAGRLPLSDLRRVANAWARQNRGEHGFSMGQFDPDLLRQQEVFLGWVGARLVGFVSLHRGRAEWTLDLMRHSAEMPAGTMHALVHAAIRAAKAKGMAQLSLAARPRPPHWLAPYVATLPATRGLVQFKQSFAPEWQPLYIAAPGWRGLLRGLIQITVAIHRPGWLGPAQGTEIPGTALPTHHGVHVEDAEIGFETLAQACDAHSEMPSRLRMTAAVMPRHRSGQTDDRRTLPPP